MNSPDSSDLIQRTGISDHDMRVEVFVICEGATEQNGRLSLVGTYEMIGMPAFPAVMPAITIAVRVRFWPAEGREHLVRLEMTNPDGLCVVRTGETSITLNPPNPDRSIAYNLIGQFKDVPFAQEGEYSVDFYLNGGIEGRLPFCVYANGLGNPLL
jgi:hypothetical protein